MQRTGLPHPSSGRPDHDDEHEAHEDRSATDNRGVRRSAAGILPPRCRRWPPVQLRLRLDEMLERPLDADAPRTIADLSHEQLEEAAIRWGNHG